MTETIAIIQAGDGTEKVRVRKIRDTDDGVAEIRTEGT